MRLLLLCLLSSNLCFSQFQYTHDQTVLVNDADDRVLPLPWAGGLNAAEFNTMDIDQDGEDDLVLFDRMASKVIVLLRTADGFTYAPEYQRYFPTEISNWMLLRDYNCDGKKDLFTSDPGGIRVFTNTTSEGEILSWEPFLFYTGFPGPKTTALLTKGSSANKVNVQLLFDDMPAIADADGDGDLDLFNMQYIGEGNIEFHQNFSMERYGKCDSLDFERITRNWGDVLECECGDFAFNGEDCHEHGRINHAGGKSLLSFDADNNGSIDVVISESECAQIFLLENEGTLEAPIVTQSKDFPVEDPAYLLMYPAAYFEDIDGDGVKDMMISSNATSKDYLQTDLSSTNYFYKNEGFTSNPSFTLIEKNFLQKDMIDIGDNAVPAFFDFDADGDLDLFVGSNASTFSNKGIHLYENTGNSTQPSFKLLNDDLFQLSTFNLTNYKIYFGDIDGTGTTDLIFSATNSFGATRIYFMINNRNPGMNLSLTVQALDLPIGASENICPTDVDGDGKLDFLIGKTDGSISFWKNDGVLNFILNQEDFLGLSGTTSTQFISPAVADLDANGKQDLFFGDQRGTITIIKDYQEVNGVAEPIRNNIYNVLADDYESVNLGGRIWLTAGRIFESSKPAIIVGTSLGGLQILKNTSEFSLYPNPLLDNRHVTFSVDQPTMLYIYTSTGRLLDKPIVIEPDQENNYKIPHLPAGFYIFRFVSACGSRVEKIILR